MNIDWITLSIWIIGFIIWIVWMIIPLKEFIEIFRSHKTGSGKGNNL